MAALENPDLPGRIEDILQENRISRNAWYQVFTGKYLSEVFITPAGLGNHAKKLISTPDLLEDILELFSPRNKVIYEAVRLEVRLLIALGDIQECARAEYLSPDDQAKLREKIGIFKDLILSVSLISIA